MRFRDIDNDQGEMLEPQRRGVGAGGIGAALDLKLINRDRLASNAQVQPPPASLQAEQTHFLSSDRFDVADNRKAENVTIEGRQPG